MTDSQISTIRKQGSLRQTSVKTKTGGGTAVLLLSFEPSSQVLLLFIVSVYECHHVIGRECRRDVLTAAEQ